MCLLHEYHEDKISIYWLLIFQEVPQWNIHITLDYHSHHLYHHQTLQSYGDSQWCSRDRNLRDPDLEVRDRDSRPHISMMVIKTNSLNNAVTK